MTVKRLYVGDAYGNDHNMLTFLVEYSNINM